MTDAKKIVDDARTKLLIKRMIDRVSRPQTKFQLMQPHMRPHTWVFLRQEANDEDPIICLGIVFHVWPRKKYNMINFSSHTNTGKEIKTSGLLTKLDTGAAGLVLKVRWPWGSLLREYKGLSAGDL
jgi:hypothetical protein